MKNNIPDPGSKKVTRKIIIALIFALIIAAVCFPLLYNLSRSANPLSKAQIINSCQYDYNQRDFGSLYGTLNSVDEYVDDYDLYTEAVQGYQLRCQCIQWNAAKMHGIPDAAERAEEYLKQLQSMADSPRFPQNRQLLQSFLEEVYSDIEGL